MFYFPFILSFIAGISTLLGSLVIFTKGNKDKIIKYSLAFASGVMLSVSIFDLIFESLILIDSKYKFFYSAFFITIGLIIPYIIDKLFKCNNKLYKIGIFSFLTIIAHNIPEGIITYLSLNADIKLGIAITLAIAIHNIPEGVSIAIPLYYSSKSKTKVILLTFIAGISEFFGAIMAYLFFKNISINIIGFLLSIVAGIMSYMSILELLPNALTYKEKKKTLIFFIIGFIFMYLNHFLIK